MRESTETRERINSGGDVNALPLIFDRHEEMEQLRQRLARRRSFLFYGPAGVGKTLLLSATLPEFPGILYSSSNATPQTLFRSLVELLLVANHSTLVRSCPKGMSSLQSKSAVALKGLLRQALLDSNYLIVIDHLMRPSQAMAATIRDLMVSWSLPVVAVTRSVHMEDAGFILPLFADRSEKLALRNLDPGKARAFAEASTQGLTPDNLAHFVEKIVEYSEGNPGALLQMIRLAHDPKYRHENRIKIAPLYIDYKIGTVSGRHASNVGRPCRT